jgi:hypothetical protein
VPPADSRRPLSMTAEHDSLAFNRSDAVRVPYFGRPRM